ncbi:Electron transport complex subunit RsxG [Hydrogenovibrio crunogenus]|uniref:Electron transport complex subunit RsxG n=1 Tax=Hydrogenovibrio crunogenus TaxID=39765 RepID=A0A4P7NXY6_9GAMM|nr:FMN-binding protein [Hydrogenovibrio crunogenus]QBZ82399.1 Electron transport complex subunit RsxG [Hydrogenovibrio crunogenus]
MKQIIPILGLPVLCSSPIAYAVQYLNEEQVQVALFGQHASFTPTLIKLNESQRDKIEAICDVRQRWKTQKAWQAFSPDKAFLGWVIIDKVIGKHEFITYATAISPKGEVLGIEIMDYRETYGGEVRQTDWRNHFVGTNKNSPLELAEDIPNISGATLSCRNVTNGVKRLLALYEVALKP